MSTAQIWVKKEERKELIRLKVFFEYKKEEEKRKEKEYENETDYLERKRGRIRETKINDSYVLREALHWFWLTNENRVTKFEESQEHT